MRKLSAFMAGAAILLAAGAQAQVLSTTAVTDQFTSGARGNETAADTVDYNASAPDGSEFLAYSGADATGTPINYINSYAGASSGDPANSESPVQDVTTIKQPDRNNLFSALTQPITVPANTRPGATSGNKVITISDDGGTNTLSIGDDTSTDYSAQVDFFAIDRSANAATDYEAAMFAIRACRNGDDNVTDYSFSIDRDGSYAIIYDYQMKTVKAVKFKSGTGISDVTSRTEGTANEAEYGTLNNVSSAWHTARIDAVGNSVTFYLDGTQFATNAGDATPIANGRAALSYRSGGAITGANESAGVFDNFQSTPIIPSIAANWSVYD